MDSTDIYKRALHIACERIADSGQKYHEANTAEGWMDVFMEAARINLDAQKTTRG